MAANIVEIADRTGLLEYEVVQRLIRLGLQGIDEIDDEMLFSAVSGPRTENLTD